MARLLFLLFLTLLPWSTSCIAMTDSTHVKILFATDIGTQNVHIELDDGRGPIKAKISSKKNSFIASATSDVPYIGVIVRYTVGGTRICTHRFWAGKGQAEIRFLAKNTTSPVCPLDNFKLTNAIDVQYRDQEFSEFTSKETAMLDSIGNSHQALFERGDTLVYRSEENFKSTVSAKKKIFDRKLMYFQEHPDDEYSFTKFSELILGHEGTLEISISQVFEAFSQRFRQSPEGQEVIRTIKGKTQREGSMALDYKAVDIHGIPFSLSDFKEKYVLMVFWATWCGPCREEIPTIKSLHETYKDSEKLVVISFAKDDDLSKVKDFITAKNMNWLQVVNDDRVVSEYGVWAVPKTVLIDTNGKIAIIEEGSNISSIVNYLGDKISRH